MPETTLYERLGEHDGVRAVVDDFYDRLLADDEIAPFFEGADMERLRRTQTAFLCEAAGGPESYDGPSIEAAHAHVPFEPGHIARSVEHLEASLDAFDVPDDDAEPVVQAVAQYESELLAGAGGDGDDSDGDRESGGDGDDSDGDRESGGDA